MSILYGCIDFKGSVDRKVIADQLFDGCKVFEHAVHNCTHLVEIASLGLMVRRTTPESFFDCGPLTYKHWVVSAYSRLDNRGELAKLLELPSYHIHELPDSEFIARAFERWGEECVHKLEGDWVISIWDTLKQELFLAKDFSGHTGVFYYQTDDFFVYCSTLRGLIHINEIPKTINPLFVVSCIASLPVPKGEHTFKDIHYLPPCHYIRFTKHVTKLVQYWEPDRIKTIRYKNQEEYYEHFLSLYDQAICNCLRLSDRVGTTLSGGLDSGSLTALAAIQLLQKNLPLHSFTSVPRFFNNSISPKNKFVDEEKHATSIAAMYSNIHHHLIYGEDIGVIENLTKALEIRVVPDFSSSNYYWLSAMKKTAKSVGVKVLINGQGGNNTISWAGRAYDVLSYSDMLRRKGGMAAVKYMLKKMFPTVNGLRSKQDTRKYYKHIFTSDFYDKYHLTELLDQHIDHWLKVAYGNSVNRRAYLHGVTSNFGGATWQNSIYEYNIEMPDPTCGRALLEFCWGIPDEVYYDGVTNRKLIRESMRGVLPDMVRLESGKGLQGIDNWQRIKRDKKEIYNFFKSMKNNDHFCTILNPDIFFEKMNEINQGTSTHSYFGNGNLILNAITLGLFIQSLKE